MDKNMGESEKKEDLKKSIGEKWEEMGVTYGNIEMLCENNLFKPNQRAKPAGLAREQGGLVRIGRRSTLE